MKFTHKTIYSFLLITLISTPYVYSSSEYINNATLESKYKEVNINDLFIISDKNFIENTDFFDSKIRYPYLRMEDDHFNKGKLYINTINIINEEFASIAINFNNKIKRESKKYKDYYEKKLKNTGAFKYQYEAFTDYNVSFNKNNILSVPFTMYEFTGGAHGLTTIKSFNYNLLTGKELALKELFKKDSNYKEVINKFIYEEISKNPSIFFSSPDGFKGITDSQNFYITDDGIVIYFSMYEIAPYSSGIPMFTISWDKIIDILSNIDISKNIS